MYAYRKLRVIEQDGVTVVYFTEHAMLDPVALETTGEELFRLVEVDAVDKLVVNFTGLNRVVTIFWGKMLGLDKKLAARNGKLALCSISKDLYDVLKLLVLHNKFKIYADEAEAVGALAE